MASDPARGLQAIPSYTVSQDPSGRAPTTLSQPTLLLPVWAGPAAALYSRLSKLKLPKRGCKATLELHTKDSISGLREMTLKVRGVEGAIRVYIWDLLVLVLSHAVVSDSAIPWTIAHQAPLSMGFSTQDYWSGLPYPPPGDFLNPGMEPRSPGSPALAGRFFTPEPPGKPSGICYFHIKGLAQLPRLASTVPPFISCCSHTQEVLSAHSLTPLR